MPNGAAAKPPALDALYADFQMLTEAVKAAAFARVVAKGKSLTRKITKPFAKGFDSDRGFDSRGKAFDQGEYLRATNRSIELKRFVLTPSGKQKGFLDYNNVYIDTVWTVAFFEKQFASNADVIRDVRKKKLEKPPAPNNKTTYNEQKELLELWIVLLNIQDFIKDFLSAEFETDVLRYHGEALALLTDIRDIQKPLDLSRLEPFLTRDVRGAFRIAVLHTASEFQFYAGVSDHEARIFFSMDIRDLGVDALQAYELSSGKVADGKLSGRRLLAQTFAATDAITKRRRLTYDAVVQAFGRYYNLLKQAARVRRTDGRAEARKAFGAALELSEELPDFDRAVHVLLGGDEIFVAADPRFEGYIHKIIEELDQITDHGRLNMRTSVAYSQAPVGSPRETIRRSHHQAMKAADEALGGMKSLERTHRRIERLIEKLEANPKKSQDAPKFRERLTKLRLTKLFVRVHWGDPRILSAKEFARFIARLRARGLGAIDGKNGQLVDYENKPVDRDKLEADAKALEDSVRAKVGRDNVRTEPPPLYGRKPSKPKDDKKKP